MDKTPLSTRVILEMLGAPKTYIEQIMKDYVQKIKKEGLAIKKEKYEDATPQDKLYSTFAELEIEFKDAPELLTFCFEALPSSVEILEPTSIFLKSYDLTAFLNDLQARLHEADLIIKSVHAQNKILDKNTTAVFHNFLLYLIKQEPKTPQELSQITGIQEKDLEPFLKHLTNERKITQNGTLYSTP